MFYIRFLKTPAYAPSGKGVQMIKTLVTIVTDLGDDFYNRDLILKPFLLAVDGKLYQSCHRAFRWTSGTRQQWINLEIPSPHLAGSWRLVVTAASESDTWEADSINPKEDQVLTLVSDSFDPLQYQKAGPIVERRFLLERNNILCIKEDTANSIARHIW